MRKVPAGQRDHSALRVAGKTGGNAHPRAGVGRLSLAPGEQQEPGVSSLVHAVSATLGIELGRHNFRLRLTGSYDQLLQLIAQHICLLTEFFTGGQVDNLVRVTTLVVEKIFVVPGAGFVGSVFASGSATQ